MSTPVKLEGNSTALARAAEGYRSNASAIDDAIEMLAQVRSRRNRRGRALDQIGVLSRHAQSELREAKERYEGTASALHTYAVKLRAAQDQADDAIERYSREESSLESDRATRRSLENTLAHAHSSGVPPQALHDVEERLYYTRRRIAATESRSEEAYSDYLAAVAKRDEAADEAIASITEALSDTNDGFWASVGNILSSIGGALSSAVKWLGDVLSAIGEFLMQFAGILVIFLIIAIVAVILGAGLLVAAIIAAVVVLVIAAALLVSAALTESGGGPYRTDEHDLVTRTADPESSGPKATDASYAAIIAQDLANMDALTQYEALYDEHGNLTVDMETLRESMASSIQVVALRSEDTGEITGWRVAFPSTKNWLPFGSALNDISTNALYALIPGYETQMQRAAFDAMTQAGVFDSDAPVMLTGWSQGGMTSAEVAIDPRFDGRELSLVTAGSPMDSYRNEFEQRGIRVTSVTHSDLVSGLEGLRTTPADFVSNDPNFQQTFDWQLDHSTGGYAQRMAERFPELREGDEVFFADFGSGIVEDVRIYEYSRDDPDLVPSVPTPSPGPAPTPPPSD